MCFQQIYSRKLKLTTYFILFIYISSVYRLSLIFRYTFFDVQCWFFVNFFQVFRRALPCYIAFKIKYIPVVPILIVSRILLTGYPVWYQHVITIIVLISCGLFQHNPNNETSMTKPSFIAPITHRRKTWIKLY